MADIERGKRIKALREERQLTQPAVAEAIPISLRAYQKYEEGGGLRDKNAKALARILGVDRADIFGRRPVKPTAVEEESQLDRIERKLDDLLSRLPQADPLDEIARELGEDDPPSDGREEGTG